MSGVEKILNRYGLEFGEVKDLDLRTVYPQNTPARPMDEFFGSTGLMTDSPHSEFAELYFKNGLKWVKKNYNKTQFCSFRAKLSKKGFDSGMVILCDSIKHGYLSGKYASDHIIVLNIPFCNSRYNLEEENRVPETFSGHHRIGALLALKRFVVPVLFCTDKSPGSCFSRGKVHLACAGDRTQNLSITSKNI